jgi:dTDP-4-amino-4,6-dideoxygalactose transaminase
VSAPVVAPELPVFQPYLGPEVRRAVSDALDAGWISIGTLTYTFEEELSSYLGLEQEGRHLLAMSSGTAALHSACLLAGAGPGDEIICPSFTYVACHQAITATGADVVFCDIDDALGIDPDSARSLIGPRTKAIMAVHYAGLPCRIDEVRRLGREHGIRVIEDAAHAFGSRHGGKAVGASGDLVCFSFGPVKVITALEGGALVTPNEDEVQAVREMRLLGVDTDRALRTNNRMWDYDVTRQGWRYHLGSIPSSIGLAQLALADTFIENRRRYCRELTARFEGIDGIRVPETDFGDVASFIYFIRLANADTRSALIEHLRQRGVATGIHFQGAHSFSYYRNARRSDLSVTERAAAEQLTLPLYSFMDEATIDRIAESVTSFFE